MDKSNKKYISEVIGQDYLNWEAGDIVEISSGTDTGKTYFIKNILLNYAKENGDRILYLCNRKNLKNQVKYDILSKRREDITIADVTETSDTIGNITITTYQALEKFIHIRDFGDQSKLTEEAKTKFNLNRYKYIVCDEAHFLLEDSSFNPTVELSYRELLKKFHNKSIKLFISGTIEDLRPSIEESKYMVMHQYTLEKDYSNYNLFCFNKLETLEDAIYETKDNQEKWLIFTNTIPKGQKLKDDLIALGIEAVFIDRTTDENKDKELSSIITDSTFNSKVLISTKVLDNGVNFEDKDLNNIVIMSHERNTFLQMLGRIRNPKNKKLNLYIYNYSNNALLCTYKNHYLEPTIALNLYRDNYQAFEDEYLWNLNNIPSNLFYAQKKEDVLAEEETITLKESGVIKFELEKERLNKLIENSKGVENRYYFVRTALEWIKRDFSSLCLLDEIIDDEISGRLEEELSFAFESEVRYSKEIFLENYNRIIESDKNLLKKFKKLDKGQSRAKGQKAFNKLFETLYKEGIFSNLYVVSSQVENKRINGVLKRNTFWVITKVDEN